MAKLCAGWKKVNPVHLSRRTFLQSCGAVGAAAFLGAGESQGAPADCRKFHLSISPDALEADPELLELAQHAGVSDVWVTGYLYGYWYYPLAKSRQWRERIEQMGMGAHLVNVPLGHPGDSLGAKSGDVPLTPPKHWRPGVRRDGATYAGTSLHPPATEENCAAMRAIAADGVKRVFVDDDFRLARGPGVIGGCFCSEHKSEFLRYADYGETQWQELLGAVAHREFSAVLRNWVDFTCDELTACFRAQQQAAPSVQLGNMIMYLGAEKAGIRLDDYHDVPFRVGELMFDDKSFGDVKGKTNELFSSLFHRRYARPELAYSETTAFPANRLSAQNMAAKLAVSTISDVRNTMFMSGVTAFPRTHWDVLGPAMKRQAEIHRRVAGHALKGPLKHFWGQPSRYVGDDNPNSLFLAMGIPFEVTNEPAADGWTFLADSDAQHAGKSPGTRFVARPGAGLPAGIRAVTESLPELFALKREIVPELAGVPYIEGENSAVLAWYPTARAALVWNLVEKPVDLTLRIGDQRRGVSIGALDLALVELG